MTRQEYLNDLLNVYETVKVLSEKEDGSLLWLKSRKTGKEMVVRSTVRRLLIADFLRTVSYEHLPEVFDAVHLEDGDVILEEAIRGTTLDRILANRTLSYHDASRMLSCISDALTLIHGAGFVHRDVKPKNIMITESGVLKLIDFDASRIAVASDDTVRLGTAGFAAPEQYVGVSDRRADIFALGVLLNVMLTGAHPSEKLPKNLRARRIVEKATAMNPEKRFASAEEFRIAL